MKSKNQRSKFKTNPKFQIPILKYFGTLGLGFILIFALGILSLGFHQAWAMARSASGNDISAKREVFIGVFREGAPRNMNQINKFTEQVGKNPAMIMWYMDWEQNFPFEDASDVINYGAVPQIVWEPWYWSNHSKVQLDDVIAGKWDHYIRNWAQEIRNFKHPVFLRLAHEFNTGTYPWSVPNNGKDANKYIKAYKHVVDVFKKEKVNNVKWVWCFNNVSNPKEAWNDWILAYPGNDYVDWIGIDGYNWGETQEWSGWEAFRYLFRDQVRLAKKLWPDKPVMIAEFSSAEKGGDKAVWIKDMLGSLKSSMRNIDAIIWFDVRKEADWRVNSSNKSLEMFRQVIQDPIFSSSGEAMANFKPVIYDIKKTQKTAQALRVPGNLTINGDLADWNKSQPIVMVDASFLKEGLSWQGPEDLSGQAYFMWDEENLYLAAEISDKIPLVNNKQTQDIWNGDALEIVLGLNPAAEPSRSSIERGDYQLGLGTGNDKGNNPGIWNWQRRRSPNGSEIVVKKTGSPAGYILEAKIPWASFRAEKYFTPTKGLKIPFDIAFDDADETGLRERQFIWNGDYYFYKDPSVWGILELK